MNVKVLAGAVLVSTLGGCIALSTDRAIPLTSNAPNPAPVEGYVVRCQSTPGPFVLLFNDYSTSCQQLYEPGGRRAVLRARG